jgi:hypothetical protein
MPTGNVIKANPGLGDFSTGFLKEFRVAVRRYVA